MSWLPAGKARCKYGTKCYQKNTKHKAAFAHWDPAAAPAAPAAAAATPAAAAAVPAAVPAFGAAATQAPATSQPSAGGFVAGTARKLAGFPPVEQETRKKYEYQLATCGFLSHLHCILRSLTLAPPWDVVR